MIISNGSILPRRICHEIKWIVEKRSSATVETGRAEIGANSPGPPQAQLGSAKKGFQTAAAQCVEAFARSASYGLHTSPAGSTRRLKTELTPFDMITL